MCQSTSKAWSVASEGCELRLFRRHEAGWSGSYGDRAIGLAASDPARPGRPHADRELVPAALGKRPVDPFESFSQVLCSSRPLPDDDDILDDEDDDLDDFDLDDEEE